MLLKAFSLKTVRQTIRVGTRDSFEQKIRACLPWGGKAQTY